MSWTELNAYQNTSSKDYNNQTGKTTGYNNEGNITYTKTDSDGNGVNEETIFYSKETNSKEITQNDNETGRIMSKSRYVDDKCQYNQTFEYYENGNTKNMNIDNDGDGKVDYIIEYLYDEDGNMSAKQKDVRPLGAKIKDVFKSLF